MHFHLDQTVTLTGLATTTLDIETETPGFVTARTGFMCSGEKIANCSEQPGIGCRVTSRCPANRALVDGHDLVKFSKPGY